MNNKNQQLIINSIPNIPDFPIKGIQFKDITPILSNPKVLKIVVKELVKKAKNYKFNYIVAPESRGFFFGILLANKLKIPFIPIRKKGKLPRPTISTTRTIEYATVSMEVCEDDIKPNSNVLVVDDLLATGGTILAIKDLMDKLSVNIAASLFVVELTNLKGKEELINNNIKFESLVGLLG